MTTPYNDFKPETRSLLKALQTAGFQVFGGHNGEYRFSRHAVIPIEAAFINELTATDEGQVYVRKDSWEFTIVLVYGNCPGELVSDYFFQKGCEGTNTMKDFEAVLSGESSKWEGRKQPTRTR